MYGGWRNVYLSDDSEKPLESFGIYFFEMYLSGGSFRIFLRISWRTPSGGDFLGLLGKTFSYREIHKCAVLSGMGADRCDMSAEDLPFFE